MRALIAACFAAFVAIPATAATLVMDKGLLRVTLLDSVCSSPEIAQELLKREAKTDAKRADIMIAGQFVRGCWGEDGDGDYIVVDRHLTGGTLYRRDFKKSPAV